MSLPIDELESRVQAIAEEYGGEANVYQVPPELAETLATFIENPSSETLGAHLSQLVEYYAAVSIINNPELYYQVAQLALWQQLQQQTPESGN